MTVSVAPAIPEPPGPLSREEYDSLVRRGALDDARVELLYGRIVTMSPQGESHSYCVTELSRVLIMAIGRRANVRVQMPFAIASSEPEPDVAVVPPGDYLDTHPTAAWLIIEVADSSLVRDRGKADLYASAGVTEYWLVNLIDGVIEVRASPGPAGYTRVSRHGRGDTLQVPVLADVTVRVDDVLPPGR